MLICGIPEDLFWNANLSFLRSVEANKHAYDQWLEGEIQKKRDA